jgi:hypothetical protein
MLIGHQFATGEALNLSEDDRARHIYCLGMSGSGKTNLMLNMARQEIEPGHGVCFIDPHGDGARTLLDAIPAWRVNDVIYLDPSDTEQPIGFNPLECHDPARRPLVADGVVSAFKHVFADSWGPRLEHFLLNACRTLLEQDGATLLGIPLLFLDAKFRKAAVRQVRDPVVRMFWELEYPSYSERLLSDALSPIFNKINRVLSSPDVRNILCQPKSTIDMREIMDGGKVLIVNLSKGSVGEGNAHLLGALLVNAIAQAALSREDTPSEERPPFHLYVDEFQNFATDSFALILSEARKYALTLTLAHQFLDQVPDALRQAVFGNCGSFISLRVGAEDAPLVAKHLGLANPQRVMDLANYRAVGRFLLDGVPTSPTHLRLEKLPVPTDSRAAQIVANSRNTRGRPRASVEERVGRFLKEKPPARRRGSSH